LYKQNSSSVVVTSLHSELGDRRGNMSEKLTYRGQVSEQFCSGETMRD
jgi:hypothetical protein